MRGYDDRDGKIWMDGALIDWRDANVHILTHAMHYASSVFEGERAYDGKIFESVKHSERLHRSGELLDMPIPYTVEEIEKAKYDVLAANGWNDAYLRVVAWRGAGQDMGVASNRNPVRMAVAAWEWVPITATPRRRVPGWTFPAGNARVPKPSPATQRRPVST